VPSPKLKRYNIQKASINRGLLYFLSYFCSVIIEISDVAIFKKKALAWAAQFDTLCYLDSNSFNDPGLGVAPSQIGDVIGIFKAYCTRVGGGPFPTELHNETGEELRRIGHEFGAVSGRPRRCGWIDLPALKYAIMLNGVTQLVMTKADVLSGFDKIYACTHYNYLGEQIDYMPYDICSVDAVPVLEEIDGWNEDLTGITELNEIPAKLQSYIEYLEAELEVPVKWLSVGPDRKQTLVLH
jgi:adenylosuccinate synthase